MKPAIPALLLGLFASLNMAHAQSLNAKPAVWQDKTPKTTDWMISPLPHKAEIHPEGSNIVLSNGLTRRIFRIQPNVACIDYANLSNGQQLLRAVKPEARLTIDGKEYNAGGLYGQKENAYLLPEWVDGFGKNEQDFQFQSYNISDITNGIHWKPKGWALNNAQPSGKMLSFVFQSKTEAVKDLVVTVHYELYDNLPLIVKWLSVQNKGTQSVTLNRVVNEILATVEEESAVVGTPAQMEKQHGIYLETNYAFNNSMRYDISDQTTHWKPDSAYTSQVNYGYQTPCLLEVYPEKATGIELQPGQTFNSVRTHELLMDSYDRERRGLAIRKMYNTIAPGRRRTRSLCTWSVTRMKK